MATCMKYYYPERYPESCKHMVASNGDCRVLTPGYCVFQMKTTQTEHAILDNLRIVKEQNLKILEQNKNIIEELALQQLQKLK